MRTKKRVKAYKSQSKKLKEGRSAKRDAVAHFGFVSGTVALLVLSILSISRYQTKPEVQYREIVLGANDNIVNREKFWGRILTETSDYLPGIVELAKINALQGRLDRAKKMLESAQEINPNDRKVKELKSYLEGND